jgi:hypothetical protein
MVAYAIAPVGNGEHCTLQARPGRDIPSSKATSASPDHLG